MKVFLILGFLLPAWAANAQSTKVSFNILCKESIASKKALLLSYRDLVESPDQESWCTSGKGEIQITELQCLDSNQQACKSIYKGKIRAGYDNCSKRGVQIYDLLENRGNVIYFNPLGPLTQTIDGSFEGSINGKKYLCNYSQNQ